MRGHLGDDRSAVLHAGQDDAITVADLVVGREEHYRPPHAMLITVRALLPDQAGSDATGGCPRLPVNLLPVLIVPTTLPSGGVPRLDGARLQEAALDVGRQRRQDQ